MLLPAIYAQSAAIMSNSEIDTSKRLLIIKVLFFCHIQQSMLEILHITQEQSVEYKYRIIHFLKKEHFLKCTLWLVVSYPDPLVTSCITYGNKIISLFLFTIMGKLMRLCRTRDSECICLLISVYSSYKKKKQQQKHVFYKRLPKQFISNKDIYDKRFSENCDPQRKRD